MSRLPADVPSDDLLHDVLPLLGLDERYASAHLLIHPGNGLPSALPVNALACGSVAAAGLSGAALRGSQQVVVDPRQVSVAFRNDRLSSIDGRQPTSFADLSGFFPAREGWVRTHANYPHHRERLLEALGLDSAAGVDDVAATIRGMRAAAVEDKVTAAEGLAVRVRDAGQWRRSHAGRAAGKLPILSREQVSEAAPVEAPYRPKVLDLTRVIAGPVATQALGYIGADVLRVDSPRLAEPLDHYALVSGDKRSTLLDLADRSERAQFDELLAEADVLVTGYRPGALDALGLDADTLAQTHPDLVVATLSAWGTEGPWGDRRGFDSIVQAATGIAMIESEDGERPGTLPAQVLDHATGYLLAAGILSALRARSFSGGAWRVSTALAATAAWLIDRGTGDEGGADEEPGQLVEPAEAYQSVVRGDVGLIVSSRPAFTIGERDAFAHFGGRFGADEPRWEDTV